MSKDPAFLFYYKDFENDTADWEADAVGWYIRLLCFQAGNGYIPSEIEELAQLARVKFSEYKIFCERWATRLALKFKPLSDTQLYNPKLSKVQAERKSGAIKKSVLAVLGNFIKTCNLTDVEKIKLKDLFHNEKSFYNILNSEKRKEIIEEFLVGKSFLIIEQRNAKRNAIKERTQQEDENENEIKDITKVKSKKYTKSDFKKALLDLGAQEQHVDDWFTVRTQKKAAFTKTAFTKFFNECNNNNYPIAQAVKICAERSWVGFEYKWLKNIENEQPTINRQTAATYEQNGRGW